jgi:short-subunit dehydrogenase
MLDRIVIVGASSGIGAALAEALAQPNRVLGLVARRADALASVAAAVEKRGGRAVVEPCDAADVSAAGPCFARLSDRMGGIDTLVYCAGIMPPVGPDEFPAEQDRAVFATNLLGAVAWLDAGATAFLAQGHGTLCGIGSVAGDRGRRPGPAYGASKAGLHTFLESLRNRLTVRGIRVVTIKPGPVATPMIEGGPKQPFVIPVEQAAKRIVRALERGEQTVYVPARWRLIMAVVRCIPSILFRRLNF